MFRENDGHNQNPLFSHKQELPPVMRKKLEQSWASEFYTHVFSQIDEAPFAVLYHKDLGRPNFPVNYLVALEFLKHWRNLTDEELLENANFHFQFLHALGINNIGEIVFAERTFYDFRNRVYSWTIEHPDQEDFIFGQFTRLTEHFQEVLGIDASLQRMDSTQIAPYIQKASRLALVFDVLKHAVESIPENRRSEELAQVLTPSFKKSLLYRSRHGDVPTRLEGLLQLGDHLIQSLDSSPLAEEPAYIGILRRLLSEQAFRDETTGQLKAKSPKQVGSNSLQSAHDSDATYHTKSNVGRSGYVANFTETCTKTNPVQIITDYSVTPNTTADVTLLQQQLPGVSERTGVEELYVDGGYTGDAAETAVLACTVTLHPTDMTGTQPKADVFHADDFEIVDQRVIAACPMGQKPLRSDEKEGNLSARFDLAKCSGCEHKDQCPVKFQKKHAVVHFSRKTVRAAATRLELATRQKTNLSYRAAIEGTISAVKRGQGLDDMKVRGLMRCRAATGCKVIGHNFQQLMCGLRRIATREKERLLEIAEKIRKQVAPPAPPGFAMTA